MTSSTDTACAGLLSALCCRAGAVCLWPVQDPRIERIPCTHKGTYADDCLCERVRQHKCYIVATCDKDLRRRIRKVRVSCTAGTCVLQVLSQPLSRALLAARTSLCGCWLSLKSVVAVGVGVGVGYTPGLCGDD